MLVTGEPLVDIAPVEPATMEGRRVVQFNKDDVEDLGLIKMDMLGLRTLSVVAEALELIRDRTGIRPDLDQLPLNDPQVFEMCSEADTIGVVQIESRAQMQTLPRTRPKSFNDLVVVVAIIRPRPIQAHAVLPSIRHNLARTAYETAWLKVKHAVECGRGVRNNQPMGFCPPSVLGEDLKRHGVTVLPVDVNRSDIRCLPEALGAAAENGQTPAGPSLLSGFLPQPADLRSGYGNFETPTTLPVKNPHRMRIGFTYVRDLSEAGRKAIVSQRASHAYTSFDDFIDRLLWGPIRPRAVRTLGIL